MRFGYARVSTQDQKLELQLDDLQKAECEHIFKEKASGKDMDRPEFEKLFSKLRSGDVLVVWKLDRLGRSIKDLFEVIAKLQEMEVTFLSLQDGINTSTAAGKLTFNIFASIAEFERDIIRERTLAGIAAAKARGRKSGRPGGLTKAVVDSALTVGVLHQSGTKSMTQIAKDLKISRATAYRYLAILNNRDKMDAVVADLKKEITNH